MLEREMKRGSAELLILALLEDRERHGYDIGKQIEESPTADRFHITPSINSSPERRDDRGRWGKEGRAGAVVPPTPADGTLVRSGGCNPSRSDQ